MKGAGREGGREGGAGGVAGRREVRGDCILTPDASIPDPATPSPGSATVPREVTSAGN